MSIFVQQILFYVLNILEMKKVTDLCGRKIKVLKFQQGNFTEQYLDKRMNDFLHKCFEKKSFFIFHIIGPYIQFIQKPNKYGAN